MSFYGAVNKDLTHPLISYSSIFEKERDLFRRYYYIVILLFTIKMRILNLFYFSLDNLFKSCVTEREHLLTQ